MAKIYLVRHCESEGNACRRTQGLVEALVTVRGYEQSEMLRRRFRDVHLDMVYSSDAFRALKTAEPIAQDHGLTVRVSILLREITTGIWEDMAWGNIAEEYPEQYQRWRETPWDLITPGASDFQAVGKRLIAGLQRIAREVGETGTALVVSHSSAIRAAQCLLLNRPITELRELKLGENTSVSLLEIDLNGSIQIDFLNDFSHLPKRLHNTWMGRPSADVNMAVYPVVLSKQRKELLNLAELDSTRRGEVFVPEEYLCKTEELLQAHPGYVAIGLLHGKPCGFVQLEIDPELPKDIVSVKTIFLIERLRNAGYEEQLFGHIAHHLRYIRTITAIAVKKDCSSEEKVVSERFVFQNLNGFPEYRISRLFCEPCMYPVLA